MKHPQPKHDSPGIWIPRAIWLLRGLSLREKALLAELAAHAGEPGYQASNERLTGLLDIQARQVRACLAALRAKGFITVRLTADNRRVIRVTGKHARPGTRSRRAGRE